MLCLRNEFRFTVKDSQILQIWLVIFGGNFTQATFVSPELLSCLPPPLMPGTVDLRVLVTHSNLTSGSVKFHFHPPIGVETVWPTMGSLYGGTYVYVYGINFQPTTAIRCRFGTIDTPSQFVNSSCISCVTPSQESYWDCFS